VSDLDPADPPVPLSDLDPAEKAKRAGSFGGVASLYERHRPGPPAAAVDWFLPQHVGRVVDLGAGTGALTRMLIERADEVVAVEPDERMRTVLTEQVPGARVVEGRGEAIPLPDGAADAVLASSSWHWMDPVPTLAEVARVLVPGGVLGAVWSGPDPEGAFVVQARALLAGNDGAVADVVLTDAARPSSRLVLPAGVPFAPVEHEVITWDVALDADALVGLLGTFSSIITMDDDARERVFSEARRLLRDLLGVEGDVTVDVAFRADCWKSQLEN